MRGRPLPSPTEEQQSGARTAAGAGSDRRWRAAGDRPSIWCSGATPAPMVMERLSAGTDTGRTASPGHRGQGHRRPTPSGRQDAEYPDTAPGGPLQVSLPSCGDFTGQRRRSAGDSPAQSRAVGEAEGGTVCSGAGSADGRGHHDLAVRPRSSWRTPAGGRTASTSTVIHGRSSAAKLIGLGDQGRARPPPLMPDGIRCGDRTGQDPVLSAGRLGAARRRRGHGGRARGHFQGRARC